MNRLGLALGSGGARGWCHIGVLRGLDDLGISPDVVAGCSMGALVGAAWAGGRLNALEDWARDLTLTRMVGFIDLHFDRGGLMRGGTVAEMMKSLDLPERIEDLDRPFVAVTTDMATGQEVWIREGSLFDAVRASISIPGLFSPHEINGRWMLDGGLINPVPVSACRALGASTTLAVNPNGKTGPLWKPGDNIYEQLGVKDWVGRLPDPVRGLLKHDEVPGPGILDVVSTSIDIMTEFLRKVRAASDSPNLTLEADLNHMSVLDLYRADEAIAEGHRLVDVHSDALRACCA